MLSLPGIELRPVQASDLSQIANLNRLAFSPLSSAEQIQADWYGGTVNLPGRRLFIAEEGATGVGSYAQIAQEISLLGQAIPTMGIAAVAVAPHRRGQKIARLMLEHALTTAQGEGIPLVMLYPFQHGFYRRLGWAWVGQSYQYPILTRHLPLFPERSRIVPWNRQQESALRHAYHEAAMSHNGWLLRQDFHWQSRLKPAPGREIYGYWDADRLLGYLILQFVEQNGDTQVVVQEWVALTAAAYRGIIGFLASLRDQVRVVVWNTYPEDPFPHFLQEQQQAPGPGQSSAFFGLVHRLGTIGGGFMWRLVDVEAALRLRPVRPGHPFSLTFQVADPILGQQSWTGHFGQERLEVSRKPATSVLKVSIEALTLLFSGVRKTTDLLWSGEIEFDGQVELLAELDAAWQTSGPFCWDFF